MKILLKFFDDFFAVKNHVWFFNGLPNHVILKVENRNFLNIKRTFLVQGSIS